MKQWRSSAIDWRRIEFSSIFGKFQSSFSLPKFTFFLIFHSFKAATNNNKNERKCSAAFFLLFFFISLFPNGFFFGERSWCVHEHEVTINRFKKCRQLFRFFHFTSHCARLFHFFFTTISFSYYLLLWGNFSLAFSCCIAKKKKKEKRRKRKEKKCSITVSYSWMMKMYTIGLVNYRISVSDSSIDALYMMINL